MSRRLSALLVLALLALPNVTHAAPTWQKVTPSSSGGSVPCTKQVSTGYLNIVAPATITGMYYVMYGGGGGAGAGGGGSSGAGGGGGSSAIVINGAVVASANGGAGGNDSGNGQNGGYATNAGGTALTLSLIHISEPTRPY